MITGGNHDAAKIDYAALLKQMQEDAVEANQEREKAGYPPIQLIGWASAPRYDAATHKMYWAKEIKFGDSPEHTLNYNIRMLGRRGVLSLNGVASMNRVLDIEAASPAIVSMVQFNAGHRYADYDAKTDKKADYSLAGIVLGGAVDAKIAAKAGLLAKIGAILLAGKKFVVIALIGIAAIAKRLFSRKGEA